jgi:GNAT superfamily N-acetyltransferase
VSGYRRQLKQWGLSRALWSLLTNRLRGMLFFAHVVVLPLRRAPTKVQQDDLEIRIASREELHLAALQMPQQLPEEFVDAAVERGDLCAAAFDRGILVGFMWVSFSGAPLIDELWAEVQPPFTYGYKSFVLPEYRGRRVLARMADARDQASLDRGCDYNVAYIETHNFASYRSAQYAGTRHFGFVGYLRLFGRYFPFRTAGARQTTFRIVRR